MALISVIALLKNAFYQTKMQSNSKSTWIRTFTTGCKVRTPLSFRIPYQSVTAYLAFMEFKPLTMQLTQLYDEYLPLTKLFCKKMRFP